MWQSEWLHMLITIINHQGQRCLMIERGGTSQREEGKDMTEMKDSSRILTFGKYKSPSDSFKCIYFGHFWVWQHRRDCSKQKEQCN